jgi:hypothetical protein
MKKIFAVILLVFASALFAQSSGGGLSFLKIAFDARNTALGDVGVAAANDVGAAAYNPALLSLENATQISFTHNAWMTDVAAELIGAKFSLLGINFGATINSSSIKDIEIRENPGEAIATFDANYFAGGLSAGFFVTEDIAVGLGAKFIYESLFSEDAHGFGFDFGAYYKGVVKNLDLSLAVQNLGSMNELKNEATDLPSSISFGASYPIPVGSKSFGASAYAAVRKYFNEDDTHLNFAAEGNYKRIVYLRFGYQTGYDARSYSFGIGFEWRGFDIDYAYAPFDYGLGDSHVVGVKYEF